MNNDKRIDCAFILLFIIFLKNAVYIISILTCNILEKSFVTIILDIIYVHIDQNDSLELLNTKQTLHVSITKHFPIRISVKHEKLNDNKILNAMITRRKTNN